MSKNTLSERAMLVSLNIRRWGASLTDKKITQEIASAHAVSEKRAGKYRKNAIDIEAPTFKAVVTAASELRNKHYFYTLPWSHDGAQILPSAMFEEYSGETRRLKANFEKAVSAFVDNYPTLKLAARRELNGMYNEADYPANIAAKFGVDIKMMSMPDEEDFRASIPDAAIAEIKEGIREDVTNSLQVAMREPYKRLYTHISRMVNRLTEKDGVFRDTLVSGLAELCSVLPGLNLTDDPQLEDLRRRAERMIRNVSAQDLRDYPAIRSDVARQAAEIQHFMSGFMGSDSKEAI